jgi:hypothetical protein
MCRRKFSPGNSALVNEDKLRSSPLSYGTTSVYGSASGDEIDVTATTKACDDLIDTTEPTHTLRVHGALLILGQATPVRSGRYSNNAFKACREAMVSEARRPQIRPPSMTMSSPLTKLASSLPR